MHIRIKLGWITILLQWIAAQARREENTQPFQRRLKKKKVVVYVRTILWDEEGTEQWNENILNETNSISSTCSVKY